MASSRAPEHLHHPEGRGDGKHRSSLILRRVGLLGFLFFLFKGVAWLAIPALALLRGCEG